VTLSGNGLFYGTDIGSNISIAGLTPEPGKDMGTRFDLVGPRYFATIGIPVLLGRDVTLADSDGVPGCWVSQSTARYFFGDANPIGRRIVAHFSFGDLDYVVRGVVGDARTLSVRGEIPPRFYLPYVRSKVQPTSAVIEVRTRGEAAMLVPSLRRVLHDVDSRLSPPLFWTLPDLLDTWLTRDRLTAQLSSVFGAMALVLASVGLYGVLAYSVGRRVAEIGVRLALGARRTGIVRLIVREALTVTVIGAAAGLAAALAAVRLIESLIFELNPRDPATFAGAALLLLLVAAAAAAVPAWRAAKTDPLLAIRGG
jgi:hypothetical protein